MCFRHKQCQYPKVNVNANDFRKPLSMSMSIPMLSFGSYSIPMSMSILFQAPYQCQFKCQCLNFYLNVNTNVNVLPCSMRVILSEQWNSHWFNSSVYSTHLVSNIYACIGSEYGQTSCLFSELWDIDIDLKWINVNTDVHVPKVRKSMPMAM